jgi:hypothetical protein
MRLSAQPARKPGSPKCLYSAPLQIEDAQIDDKGDVTVSIITEDIYSKDSKQLVQITVRRRKSAFSPWRRMALRA